MAANDEKDRNKFGDMSNTGGYSGRSDSDSKNGSDRSDGKGGADSENQKSDGNSGDKGNGNKESGDSKESKGGADGAGNEQPGDKSSGDKSGGKSSGLAVGDAAGIEPEKESKGGIDTEATTDDKKGKGGPLSGKKDKKEKSLPMKLKAIAAKIASAAHAAVTALKMFLLFQLIAMLQAVIAAVVAAIASIISTIISVITAVVTTVATVIGVSLAVAAVGVFGVFAAIVVAVAVVAVVIVNNNTAVKDDIPSSSCEEVDMEYMDVPDGIAPQAWTNAKLIYSFFKTYSQASVEEAGTEEAAITDAMIAAILGNWNHESGIDTTSVETIFDEKYAIGPKKQFLWQGQVVATRYYDSEGHYMYTRVDPSYKLGSTMHTLVGFLWREAVGNDYVDVTSDSKYDFPADSTSVVHQPLLFNTYYFEDLYHSDYWHGDGHSIDQTGIGLGQWTNSRNEILLEYADEVDGEWYDLDVQLMFILAKDTNQFITDSWYNDFHETSYTIEDGTTYTNGMEYNGVEIDKAAEIAYHTEQFLANWEGISNDSLATRIDAALLWYSIITEWEEGVDYTLGTGSSLWDDLEAASSLAYDATEVSDSRSCVQIAFMGNSSIAEAAVSYAWGPNKDDHNDGTLCWQHLFSTIFPGDPYFRSCDRTAAVAVRWSGADSNYPAGNVKTQYEYLRDKDLKYRAMLSAHGSGGASMTDDTAYWMQVDMSSATTADEFLALLQPGDILIRSDAVGARQPGFSSAGVSHTLVYTGSEIIQRRFANADDNYKIVSGSIDERSPSVGHWTTGGNNAATLESYLVYRNVKRYVSEEGKAWIALTCAGHMNEQ